MYRVDGLIDYYYQRKLTGMELSAIEESLESQQHIEDRDRSTIIQEVIRREEVSRKSEAKRKLLTSIIVAGLILSIITTFILVNRGL